ncbi:hypothetical protein [Natrinema sp. HArc-T2]|uniref:DUF7282 domain-containing protein n=1 Tax=Natrinema sp. HArc-T2 TaxID=3242701 RepID=UPI00359E3577
MNARNQVLVVLTALMLVCSSGAMVTAATSGNAIQSSDTGADGYDSANETANETTNETGAVEPAADNETDAADNESAQQPAYVTFNNQTTDGETVVVENVTLASPGFVTIHNSSLLIGDAIGSVIGTSEYLEAGTHENVTVTLDDPLEESETLIAMPHRDTNQNETYDFVETEGEEDVPFLTPDGEPVTDEAVVTVEGAAEDTVTQEQVGEDETMDEEDNVSDEEPTAEDDMMDEEDTPTEEDNVSDEEPVAEDETMDDEDNVSEAEDNVSEEEPADEMPVAEPPVDGEGQPIFITVENPTIEDVTLENITVYMAVVGEDVDTDRIIDQINNIVDGDVSADNVTVEETPADEETVEDEMEDDEDNLTEEDNASEEAPVAEDDMMEDEDNASEEAPVAEDDMMEDEDNASEEAPVAEDDMMEDEDNASEEEPADDDLGDDNVTGQQQVADENATDEVEVEDGLEATAFNISDLEAPENATIGENITVTANVSNPTDAERTETIEFRLEGDLVAEQNVTLESGASEIVEFEVDTTGLEPGEYIHMVLGDEAGEVATIELTEADGVGVEEGVDENETDEDEIGINGTDDGFDDGADSNMTAD